MSKNVATICFAAVLTVLLSTSSFASITFEGGAALVSINSTCASLGLAVGDYYTITYRFKQTSTDSPDALNFIGVRNAYHIVSTTSDGSLNEAASTVTAFLDSHGSLNTGYVSSATLTIANVAGLPTAQAQNVKVVGTINDFENNPGCDVTVHGDIFPRPNP